MEELAAAHPVQAPGDLFDLTGRVVLVTGASSGLGARWARVVAAAGAQVVITARRESELARVAAGISGAVAIAGDITSPAHREHLVAETLRLHDRIDVLVNNAGIATSEPALDTPAATLSDTIDVDLVAPFELSVLVGRTMISAGAGSIINVASLAAERCVVRFPLAAYNAAKAGLVGLTRSLASEWGPHGVRVNAIGPAFFPTRMSGFLESDELVAWITEHTALRRTARLDELDGTLLFLASDASSFITGQHLLVDGGWSVY